MGLRIVSMRKSCPGIQHACERKWTPPPKKKSETQRTLQYEYPVRRELLKMQTNNTTVLSPTHIVGLFAACFKSLIEKKTPHVCCYELGASCFGVVNAGVTRTPLAAAAAEPAASREGAEFTHNTKYLIMSSLNIPLVLPPATRAV